KFTVRLLPSKALKNGAGQALRLQSRPVSLPKAQFYPVDVLQPCWVEFASVSLLGLTAFFVFEAESEDRQLRREFVLNVPLQGEPEGRHEAILRNLLGDQD